MSYLSWPSPDAIGGRLLVLIWLSTWITGLCCWVCITTLRLLFSILSMTVHEGPVNRVILHGTIIGVSRYLWSHRRVPDADWTQPMQIVPVPSCISISIFWLGSLPLITLSVTLWLLRALLTESSRSCGCWLPLILRWCANRPVACSLWGVDYLFSNVLRRCTWKVVCLIILGSRCMMRLVLLWSRLLNWSFRFTS